MTKQKSPGQILGNVLLMQNSGSSMLLGAHFPIRPTLTDALKRAEHLGCEAIQIFGYRRHEFYFDPGLTLDVRRQLEKEIDLWRAFLRASTIEQVVVHSRHVAILAASDSHSQKKAQTKLKNEIELANLLGADCFVFHLGPYGLTSSLDEGLKRVCEVLSGILEFGELPTRIILENVPGGARRMGAGLEEFSFIAEALGKFSKNFSFCLDLAHLWAAGYKINTQEGLANFFESLKKLIDPKLVVMFHLNNTKVPLGSHIDEHRHLWDGVIRSEVFSYLLKEWPLTVAILETPKDNPEADRKNLRFLLSLEKS